MPRPASSPSDCTPCWRRSSGPDDEAIPAAIDRAVAWGATSGTDCLLGVLIGLDVAAGVRGAVGLMSAVQSRIFPNSYRDSVELMQIAAEIESLAGIDRAGLVMATPANREVLAAAGLLSEATASAGPNDLVVAVASDDESAATQALERAAERLAGPGTEGPSETTRTDARTLAEGVAEVGANLALISTPGTYATAEALKALKHGLNVFLFSDNVPVEDEIELKSMARARGLLVMGPDCGTAILDGVPLGFANAVRRGTIGLVGASGTGLQQVSCLIDRYGAGVSQAIGVGGRDLDERVGGTMMLAALERLGADPGTELIVLISKPPSASVTALVLAAAGAVGKPVIINFLGGDPAAITAAGADPGGDVRGGRDDRQRDGAGTTHPGRRRPEWGGHRSQSSGSRGAGWPGSGAMADPRALQRRLTGGRGEARPGRVARGEGREAPRDRRSRR